MFSPKRLLLLVLILVLAIVVAREPRGMLQLFAWMSGTAAGNTLARTEFLPSARPEFQVSLWADVPNARSLALSPDGRLLFVGTRKGDVHKVTISETGECEKVEIFQTDLVGSNGVCFLGDDLYVGELRRIVRFPAKGGFPLLGKGEVVLEGLPNETHHGWRYMKASPEGRLMLAIGAPCNVCLRADDERFASICSLKPDGTDFRVEARGVRNSVGFDWHPGSGDFYFTDNGRDMLGDDIPPCELNVLPKGKTDRHYGFPFFWGDNQRDEQVKEQPPEREFSKPVVKFGAHTAPLGCYFPRHERWKGLLDGKALVAQHGSWNRSTPAGYQVVAVDPLAADPKVEPFLWGFLGSALSNYRVSGRPVDVTELADGTLLISDDNKGKLWAVRPKN